MLRFGFAVSVAVSAVSHAYLYVRGYQHIPVIGAAFLVGAGVSFAVAVLILFGGPGWLCWVAAAAAGGSLTAFALSRTVGTFGFSERGWDPAPHAGVSAGAELATVALWVAVVAARRRSLRRS
ncbi:MAG: hypothetical protein K2X56_05695 [Mycobacterium pseudokansasii]|nr:hypothetical protein A4G27_18745 [Mycobacterium kansasii]MBY0387598.1 hypothetical protein [Mycobacterium pseudokansasii]